MLYIELLVSIYIYIFVVLSRYYIIINLKLLLSKLNNHYCHIDTYSAKAMFLNNLKI